jgi:hypothetical protein
MVMCHPRWLPTSGLTEFAMCWGGAGFEPRTTDLQSGALPLSHLTSLILNSTQAGTAKGSGGGTSDRTHNANNKEINQNRLKKIIGLAKALFNQSVK